MEDMRDVYTQKSTYLEQTLAKTTLTQEQKELVSNAIEFGYSAAFCSRTCDMNEIMFQAERFDSGYKSMLKLLK